MANTVGSTTKNQALQLARQRRLEFEADKIEQDKQIDDLVAQFVITCEHQGQLRAELQHCQQEFEAKIAALENTKAETMQTLTQMGQEVCRPTKNKK